MNWSLALSPFVIILASILWGGAVFLSWLHWVRSGKRPAVARLEILRLILITMLGFTLLRPEYVQQIQHKEEPEIAILVDRSSSMDTRDLVASNIISRNDWVSHQITNRFWEPLEQNARVALEEFANPSTDSTNQTAPEGTDLNAVLDRTFERERNLRAVLLLTDGDWNMGKSPNAAAMRYRDRDIPIFSVAVGSETALPDLELQTVSAPSYGLFGEQITIPFSIRNTLSNEVSTTIKLTAGEREEASKEIVIPAGGQLQDAILWYPRAVGEMELKLSVPVQPTETLPENNEKPVRIAIRVDKLRVLVVDSLPRWEYRFLRNALARDPGVEMESVLFHPQLRTGGGRGYLDRFPDSKELISKYDVIFLGDVGIGQGELSEASAELIKGLVEQQGSGLVFVPGRRGRQASLGNTALKDLLPVVLEEGRPEGISLQNEAQLTLTSQGKGHLLTRFEAAEDLNEGIWQNLPGFFWSAAVEKSRPGSEVLGVHSSLRNSSGRLPLLVTRSAGSGKVLFLGTDSAWRWRRGVEDKYHYRFWSQVVRWMAHQRHLAEKEGIRLVYSPEAPRPHDTVFLQATVLNTAGFPAEEGPVTGSIVSPDGRTEQIQFAGIEGGWGLFKSSFSPVTSGKFKVTIESPAHGRKLETELLVQAPTVEQKGQPINRAILAEIATLTGGTNVLTSGLDEVISQIALTPQPKPLERRTRLWSSPWWGGAILSLMTFYWIGRKMGGML